MSDLNSISITARLTKDAVRKEFRTGTTFAAFDVANNTGFGEYAKVNYFKCILMGKRAESLTQYLRKGTKVAIVGTLEVNDWTNKDGVKVKDWQLKVQDIALLGSSDKTPDMFDDGGEGDTLKRQAEDRYRQSSKGTKHEPLYEEGLY
jgi:single-strand DNA-binding protein